MSPTNAERSEWARTAVNAFAVETRTKDEPLDEQVSDLLADLMHLCDAEGLDFNELSERGQGNHEAEVQEEQE
jgi:hypothetical protein